MSAPTTIMEDRSTAPAGLPRLFASGHGAAPRMRASELIDVVQRAGLRGRGGAAFPTALKLHAVASARRSPVVVVNASDSEPGSSKDMTLLEVAPELVLDGARLVAGALKARELYVCVESPVTLGSLARGIQIVTVPRHYVAGQETALVNHINGGPPLPVLTPVRERGVGGRPTLVSNAETFAHIALIASYGPEWFRELGTDTEPGSILVTLSGPVRAEGVYEVERGSSLASLVRAAGGTTEPLRGGLMGGYGGGWIGPAELEGVVLSDEWLGARGSSLGPGIVQLLGADDCPVAETAAIVRWMADRSAGQCGPCVHGLDALAQALDDMVDDGELERLAQLVQRRGACAHPDGVSRLVLSLLRSFADEVDDHARHGRCDSCLVERRVALPPLRARLPERPLKPMRAAT